MAERSPFALPQMYVTRRTSKDLVYVEGPVVQLLKTVSSKVKMAENITIVQRDKVFPELFDKIMKENVDLTFSSLPLFHFGETILKQTRALSTQRGKFLVPCGKNFHRWNSVIASTRRVILQVSLYHDTEPTIILMLSLKMNIKWQI